MKSKKKHYYFITLLLFDRSHALVIVACECRESNTDLLKNVCK